MAIYFLFIKCDFETLNKSTGIITNYGKNSIPQNILLKNYDDYKKFWKSYSGFEISTSKIKENDFKKYDYVVYFYKSNKCAASANKPLEKKVKKNKLYINAVNYKSEKCASNIYAYLIDVPKGYYQKVPKIIVETEDIKDNEVLDETKIVAKKPILYLYPKQDSHINVRLQHENNIITSYPKYKNQVGWNVYAKTNGTLYADKNMYYALYWDEVYNNKINFETGFYVEKNNAIEFLEEKLKFIGLNYRERNEFIMYWLAILEKNEKNLIYFELTDERQNSNMLLINPIPDSLLRINMHVKKVDKKINIKEQKLQKFERKGFVAVEWAGTIEK